MFDIQSSFILGLLILTGLGAIGAIGYLYWVVFSTIYDWIIKERP